MLNKEIAAQGSRAAAWPSETPRFKGCRAHPCRKRGIINPSNDQTQSSITAERSVGSHEARSGLPCGFCSMPNWTEPEQLGVLWKDFLSLFPEALAQGHLLQLLFLGRGGNRRNERTRQAKGRSGERLPPKLLRKLVFFINHSLPKEPAAARV